ERHGWRKHQKNAWIIPPGESVFSLPERHCVRDSSGELEVLVVYRTRPHLVDRHVDDIVKRMGAVESPHDNIGARWNPMDERALKAWRIRLRAELIARRLATTAEDRTRWSSDIDAHLERLLTNVSGQLIAFCWPYRAEYDARSVMLRLLTRGA